jgi:hypothetical protein
MDRQDIDALLIGALYGELTPADEARLTAHLESHPGDRGALDDLKVARQAVHDSRIFAVQMEPPQAVSALLLQEAHRRAPKRAAARDADAKESWFYRFTRSFLAHPAMAAAAMLVLVLGGAGIVYMRKGDDQFAARQIEAPAAHDEAAMQRPAGNTAALEQGSALADGIAAGSGYTAGLYEGNAEAPAKEAPEAKPADSAADRWGEQQALDNKTQALAKQEQLRDGDTKAKRAAPSSIAVGTAKGDVKELERARSKSGKSDDDSLDLSGDSMSAPGAATGGGGAPATGAVSGRGNVAADKGYAQPPPPPAQAAPAPTTTSSPEPAKKTAATAKPAPRTSSTATIAKAPPKAAENTKTASKPDSTLIAWAKAEHARAVALAQKGECTSAAKVALSDS